MGLEDEIRKIAHRIWEEEGRPEGHDLEHWLKAEFVWNATHDVEAAKSKAKPEQPARPTKQQTSKKR